MSDLNKRFWFMLGGGSPVLQLPLLAEDTSPYPNSQIGSPGPVFANVVAATTGTSGGVSDGINAYTLWNGSNYTVNRGFFKIDTSAITNCVSARFYGKSGGSGSADFYLYKFVYQGDYFNFAQFNDFTIQYSGRGSLSNGFYQVDLNASAIADINANSSCYFMIREWRDVEVVAPTDFVISTMTLSNSYVEVIQE